MHEQIKKWGGWRGEAINPVLPAEFPLFCFWAALLRFLFLGKVFIFSLYLETMRAQSLMVPSRWSYTACSRDCSSRGLCIFNCIRLVMFLPEMAPFLSLKEPPFDFVTFNFMFWLCLSANYIYLKFLAWDRFVFWFFGFFVCLFVCFLADLMWIRFISYFLVTFSNINLELYIFL